MLCQGLNKNKSRFDLDLHQKVSKILLGNPKHVSREYVNFIGLVPKIRASLVLKGLTQHNNCLLCSDEQVRLIMCGC